MVGCYNPVLKKISYYVKSIVFNHNHWISRSNILHQIYILDNDTSEFTSSNLVTVSLLYYSSSLLPLFFNAHAEVQLEEKGV